ncbi:MAG TPA: 3-oxoacyl-ACP reductase FabG [Blastocatellia bacterium]|nr:3-oxoacyl-ACP reductase FabG [Blastocatellia bacterium]
MKLKDKVAIITGAGSGIGRAIALRFAEEGARIVIADINEANGEETLRVAKEKGVEGIAIKTDVGNSEDVAKLFARVDDLGWSVDILVNNAGNTSRRLSPTQDTTDSDWQSIINVHLNGTFYCTREALKRMTEKRSGAIINISSMAAYMGLPGAPAYTAAKGGIMAFTKGVAREVAAVGIRVNCIAPGWVDTPILENLPSAIHKMMTTMTPLGRIGRPEEIAAAALFLASDESTFIIGQVISPNGGAYS